MKSLLGEERAPFPRLCPACSRTLGQRRNLRSPLAVDTLRAPADGMVSEPDPRAERIRARRERREHRAALRAIWRHDGLVAAATFFLDCAKTLSSPPASEECQDCLALNKAINRAPRAAA